MPLRKVLFAEGGIYHVYNRGNARREVFLSDKDHERFETKLSGISKKHNISVLAYCLMRNHFHLLLRQDEETSLSDMMRKLLVSYSMYFNIRHDNVGSVFQGRFKAKIIESDASLLQVARYIHQNPQPKTGTRLEDYVWSSYPVYLGLVRKDWVKKDTILGYYGDKTEEFKKFVEDPLEEDARTDLSFDVA